MKYLCSSALRCYHSRFEQHTSCFSDSTALMQLSPVPKTEVYKPSDTVDSWKCACNRTSINSLKSIPAGQSGNEAPRGNTHTEPWTQLGGSQAAGTAILVWRHVQRAETFESEVSAYWLNEASSTKANVDLYHAAFVAGQKTNLPDFLKNIPKKLKKEISLCACKCIRASFKLTCAVFSGV